MSEESWNRGLDDASQGIHRDGQGEDYELGWSYGQWPPESPEMPEMEQPEPMPVPEGCIEVIDEREEPVGELTKADIESAVKELKWNSDPKRMAELQYAFECLERHRFDGNPPPGTIDVWNEREESV